MDKIKEIDTKGNKSDLDTKNIGDDFSITLVISKLNGLIQLMLSFNEDACGIEYEGIHGIGLILQNILNDLREVQGTENKS